MKTQSYLAAAVLLGSGFVSHAALTAVDLGTGAPPATLGGYTITLFPDDTRPVIADVMDVPSPLGGDITFDIPVSHREIGTGWATWSHGYTGDVYYSNGATSLTIGLPAGTLAFLAYAEPNPFSVLDITATAQDGTTITIPVNGSSGANGFGFYSDGVSPLTSITFSSSVDFAVGEFGIAATPVPETSTVMGGIGLAALCGLAVWRRKARA
jgi:MYXO-CTERM domain-containing protein